MQTEQATPHKVEDWSVEEVADYLDALRIKKDIIKTFVHNDVTGFVFASLTADDLRSDPFNLKGFADIRAVQLAISRATKNDKGKATKVVKEYPTFSDNEVVKRILLKSICIWDTHKFDKLLSQVDPSVASAVLFHLLTCNPSNMGLATHAVTSLVGLISQKDKDEALKTACIYVAHIDLVSVILKAGANVNAVDELGCSPLFYSLLLGDPITSHMLLDSGANNTAILTKQESIGRLSLKQVQSSTSFLTGDTILVAAVFSGLATMVNELLNRFTWQDQQIARAMLVAIGRLNATVLGVLLDNRYEAVNTLASCSFTGLTQPNGQKKALYVKLSRHWQNNGLVVTSPLAYALCCAISEIEKQVQYQQNLSYYQQRQAQPFLCPPDAVPDGLPKLLEVLQLLCQNGAVVTGLNATAQGIASEYPQLASFCK